MQLFVHQVSHQRDWMRCSWSSHGSNVFCDLSNESVTQQGKGTDVSVNRSDFILQSVHVSVQHRLFFFFFFYSSLPCLPLFIRTCHSSKMTAAREAVLTGQECACARRVSVTATLHQLVDNAGAVNLRGVSVTDGRLADPPPLTPHPPRRLSACRRGLFQGLFSHSFQTDTMSRIVERWSRCRRVRGCAGD